MGSSSAVQCACVSPAFCALAALYPSGPGSARPPRTLGSTSQGGTSCEFNTCCGGTGAGKGGPGAPQSEAVKGMAGETVEWALVTEVGVEGLQQQRGGLQGTVNKDKNQGDVRI